MLSMWGTEHLWTNARRFARERNIMPADVAGSASPRAIAAALVEQGWDGARFHRANY
jgi:hypothetical protein